MSIAHWLIVVGVIVLLFGRNKISDLMGDVAQGIKSFRKGMQEDEPASVKPDENELDRHRASMLRAPASSRVGDNL